MGSVMASTAKAIGRALALAVVLAAAGALAWLAQGTGEPAAIFAAAGIGAAFGAYVVAVREAA